MTDELLDLWEDGLTIGEKILYVALTCVACDRPAGFLGHSFNHACSYCHKHFHYNNEWKKIDYYGFHHSTERTHSDHKKCGGEWLRAKTQADRNMIEKQHGSFFSQLTVLPYFNCIENIVVDPMHNLFEGTAKRVLKKVWLNDWFGIKDTTRIHTVNDSFKTTSSMGRLPRKVITGFSSFTADQWKNWTLWFSSIAVHDF